MPDLDVLWGQDASLTLAGDLVLADGITLSNERVLRRLLTAMGGYIWHTDYGAGLPQRIGGTSSANQIAAVVRAQLFQEASVSRNPAPTVVVTPIAEGFTVSIKYVEASSGAPTLIQFDLTPPGTS